ncbi:cold-shock protein [Lentzea sp. NPDC058436]|uniref:cold-shock protein n=1 Tax=Lentzea sp. NPDC058436 TaxID=3346499 RepID=UPI003648EBA0
MELTGRVVRFDDDRGYGFIAPDSGQEDVFLHANGVLGGGDVATGTRVTFRVMEGQRGLKAYDVKVVGDGEVPPVVVEETVKRDVLTAGRYATEITETLIAAVPQLTGAQIADVRTAMVGLARGRGWVDG